MTHNMTELRDRFYRLIKTLDEKYAMSKYITEGYCPEDLYNEWDEFDDAADHYGVWCGTGATKFVIGDEDYDYVIKFQPCGVDYYDYCAKEEDVYLEAELRNLHQHFAWTAHLFDYTFEDNGVVVTLPIYVMEWCQCGYDFIDDEADEFNYQTYIAEEGLEDCDRSRDKYYSDGKYRLSCEERIFIWAESIWGNLEYLKKFLRNMSVNDLHAGNWGWCNNRIVLVDYSGYGEDEGCREIDF